MSRLIRPVKVYILGRIVHHAAATYRGDGKTDAKDARIIADQARMRTDLQPVRITFEIAVDLRLLTSHRLDVIHYHYNGAELGLLADGSMPSRDQTPAPVLRTVADALAAQPELSIPLVSYIVECP